MQGIKRRKALEAKAGIREKLKKLFKRESERDGNETGTVS